MCSDNEAERESTLGITGGGSEQRMTWRRGLAMAFFAAECYAILLLGALVHTSVKENMELIAWVLVVIVVLFVAQHVSYRRRPRPGRRVLARNALVRAGIFALPAAFNVWPLYETGQLYVSRCISAEVGLLVIAEGPLAEYVELHGYYPSNLEDALQPSHMHTDDGAFGGTYRYRRLEGGKALIYSVGPDRDDDGGEKVLGKDYKKYLRGRPPFVFLPGFLYKLTHESTLIDGDICLFLLPDTSAHPDSTIASAPL